MKIISKIFCLLFISFSGCKTNQTDISETSDKGLSLKGDSFIYINGPYLKYPKNSSIIRQELIINKEYIGGDNPSSYSKYHGNREGYIESGIQKGKWISTRYFNNDSLGYNKSKKYIFREEYFKNGLRDSIFKIYDIDGKIIYSTAFNKGTGIEKDFHENGKLYYEIATKSGYFIDTLKLYNDKGKLIEKLFYKNDSLVYYKKYN